ncbi:hypothetical protein SAMN05660816_03554 [Niastella yeongjuensis]|nr:hypothetical protein SAMN05660816_03554 [Niastella yeongjuensis]
MMNTIRKFLKDVSNIFSSVPEIRKQILRAIAPKSVLKFSYARSVKISTTQLERRTVIASKSGLF